MAPLPFSYPLLEGVPAVQLQMAKRICRRFCKQLLPAGIQLLGRTIAGAVTILLPVAYFFKENVL
jgi:hypothetical protein